MMPIICGVKGGDTIKKVAHRQLLKSNIDVVLNLVGEYFGNYFIIVLYSAHKYFINSLHDKF